MMKRQQGFALIAALILLIILTIISFSAVNTGKMVQQVSKTTARYNEVYAVAESELYRVLGALKSTRKIIDVLPSPRFQAKIEHGVVTKVSTNIALAKAFGSNVLPDFSDFNNQAWDDNDSSMKNTFPTNYGSIETTAFIQQLASRRTSRGRVSGTGTQIENQYLVTVKASSKNSAGASAPAQEKVVIQSIFELRFIK